MNIPEQTPHQQQAPGQQSPIQTTSEDTMAKLAKQLTNASCGEQVNKAVEAGLQKNIGMIRNNVNQFNNSIKMANNWATTGKACTTWWTPKSGAPSTALQKRDRCLQRDLSKTNDVFSRWARLASKGPAAPTPLSPSDLG
jgi:hypothetical protein